LRRENAKVWLFETVDRNVEAKRFLNLAPRLRGEVDAHRQMRGG
jgi:hypothetical protein